MAAIANHTGDTEYRAIHKKSMSLLQNIKWNRRTYPLENYISNHRQVSDDILKCNGHITVAVPDLPQRVEYLIDLIICSDNNLQTTLVIIRVNNNIMKEDFELASSVLIDVDPYHRSKRPSQGKSGAKISSIDFSTRRVKSGVDFRWHHPKELKALPSN